MKFLSETKNLKTNIFWFQTEIFHSTLFERHFAGVLGLADWAEVGDLTVVILEEFRESLCIISCM